MTINDYKVFVKNVTLDDAEWAELLKTVVSDIAHETRIFKKMVGFTIEPTLEYYDFDAISQLHDKFEVEIDNITIGSFDFEDVISISNGCVPSLSTTETTLNIEADNMILDVHDVMNTSAKSIFRDFTYMQGYTYRNDKYDACYEPCEVRAKDETCDEPNDDAFVITEGVDKAIAVVSFEPDFSVVTAEIERRIRPAIISGLKFFANDIFNDKDDAAVANVFYQRYFAAKRELINKYPYFNSRNTIEVDKKYI